MRARILLAALVPLAALTACTDDDAGPDAPEAEGFSVAHALDQLQAPDDGPFAVTMADVGAVSDANGLEPSDPEWLAAVTGAADSLAMLTPPANVANTDPAVFAAAAGFSWAESDWFASVSVPPDEFTVYAGLADVLDEDGVSTLGEGEDYATDVDGDLDVDPLGRPLHLAQARGLLASSLSTPMIEGWVDDGGDLGGDDSLAAVADALDDADVVSAFLQTLDGDVATVGVGWAVADGAPVVTLGYDLGSDDAAEAAGPGIETAYAEGTSLVTQQPYAELLPDAAVEVHGRVVVVTVHPDAGRVGVPLRMIAQQDLPGLS